MYIASSPCYREKSRCQAGLRWVLALTLGAGGIPGEARASPAEEAGLPKEFARELTDYDLAAAGPPTDERKKYLLSLIRQAKAAPSNISGFVCPVIARIFGIDADLARAPNTVKVRERFAALRGELEARLDKPCPAPAAPPEPAPPVEPPVEPLPGSDASPAPATSDPESAPATGETEPTPTPGVHAPEAAPDPRTATEATPPAPGRPVRGGRTAMLAGGAVGVVGGAAGVGLLIAGAVKVRLVEQDFTKSWEEHDRIGDRFERVAIFGAILGGVGLVSGVTLLALGARHPSGPGAAHPRWRWTGSGVRLAF